MLQTPTAESQPRPRNAFQAELLEGQSDPALDDAVRVARQIANSSGALLVIFDGPQARVRAHTGFSQSDLPLIIDSQVFATNRDRLIVFEDLRNHSDPEIGELARAFRGLRFYAEAPLMSGGEIAGLLCAMDHEPRRMSAPQREAFSTVARQLTSRMEQTMRLRTLERESRAKSRVEQALTVERNFVSAALDTVGSLVLVLDTAGRIVRFNRAAEIISGFTFAELVGKPFWEKLVPKEQVNSVIRRFEAMRSGVYPQSYSHQWLTRSGERRQIDWSATGLLDSQGTVNFLIATGVDVTDRRHAEATLRESEARYRQLVESSLGVVATHDLRGKLLSINRAAARNLGYEPEELVGTSLTNLIAPAFRDTFGDYMDEVAREGEEEGLLHLLHRNGESRTIAFRNRLIQIEGRDPFVLSHGVDITSQIQTERLLQTLSRQSQSILETVGDGIIGVDVEGNCTFVNPAAAKMLGYASQELMGSNIHDAIHHTRPDGTSYPRSECLILRGLRSLEPVRVDDEVFWRKDGTSFPVEYTASPQLDNGKPIGIVFAFQDTTERRALDRMKDEFISTVSHELRTPLTSLRAALGLLMGGTLQVRPEKQQQMLEIAVGNCDRLVQLVNDILDLERIESGKLQLHAADSDLDNLMRRATDLMESAAMRAGIRVEVAPGHQRAWVDADRILQTLTNLLSNAIKFSPRDSVVRLFVTPWENGFIRVSVCDRGRGIPEDKLEAIFERFHQIDASDSRAMGGTGLGLAICRSIVAQHGGRIWAEHNAGGGSCFHFTVPKPARSTR